jgi:hypothetical protein
MAFYSINYLKHCCCGTGKHMLLLTGRGMEVHCVTGTVVHCCRVLEVQVGRLTGRHTFRGTEVHRGTGITWGFFCYYERELLCKWYT